MQRRVTLDEVNRKLDIILGVLVEPKHVEAVQAGRSIDDVLRDEACALAARTGDHGYITDYQRAKNARRKNG